MSLMSGQVSYATQLLPVFLVLGLGFGISFVAITVAATSGVPAQEAGLASGLINTSQQVGAALGLAVLSVVAGATTTASLAAGKSVAAASVLGFQRAFLTAALLMAVALVVGIVVIRSPEESHESAYKKADEPRVSAVDR